MVRLQLSSPAYFDAEYVTACLSELESLLTLGAVLKEPLSPLHKLALHVLLDSAYIDWPKAQPAQMQL